MDFTWQSVYKLEFSVQQCMPSAVIFYYYLFFTTSFIFFASVWLCVLCVVCVACVSFTIILDLFGFALCVCL